MHGKNIQLWLVTVVPRTLMVIAYVWVGVCLIKAIRGAPSVAVATRPLSVNQVVGPGDVQTTETAALVGKYLHKDVAPGQPVSPSIVGRERAAPKIAPAAVGLIVRIPSVELLNRGIQEGSSVLVTAKSDSVSGTVEKIDCHGQQCAVFVSIAGKVPLSFDAQALAAADIRSDTPIVP